MLSINSNNTSMMIANMLNAASKEMEVTSKRLSSGKRILSASDDPAGMGILSSLKSQDSSYNAVQKNLSAGQSLLEVANSSLEAQQGIMKQMKDLATQAASGTLSAADRTALNNTFTQLQTQLDQAVNGATLFGQNLTGSTAASVTIQSGIKAADTFTINTAKSDGATLGVDSGTIDLTTAAKATAAMTAIDTAVASVSSNQAIIGAQQNGLKEMVKNATTVQTNLAASISRIEDVDMAAESTKLAQLQTKTQLATSMLSIANQMPSYILQLLR